MSRITKAVLLLSVSFSTLVVSGCGGGPADAPNLHTVMGAVTLDGEPIETGFVTFVPDSPSAHRRVAPIKSGKYSVELESLSYRVEIVSEIESSPGDSASGDLAVVVQVIPERYNVESELKFDATSGKTVSDFNLES